MDPAQHYRLAGPILAPALRLQILGIMYFHCVFICNINRWKLLGGGGWVIDQKEVLQLPRVNSSAGF